MMIQKFTLEERLWSKVIKTGNCWEWTGCCNDKGYGQINLNNKRVYVHRVSYELYKGKIPERLQIDHLCRNRNCVNPDHLEAVTQRENILRGVGVSAKHSKKTHCKNGHEFTPENTGSRRDNPNNRICLTCRSLHNRKGDMLK